MCRAAENLSHPTNMFLAEVRLGDTLPPCFSSVPVHNCPFAVYLVLCFSHFLVCFLLVILFKKASRPRAEVLASIPTLKKVVMCLVEKKTCVREASFRHEF